jgi:hypothetical protein
MASEEKGESSSRKKNNLSDGCTAGKALLLEDIVNPVCREQRAVFQEGAREVRRQWVTFQAHKDYFGS